MTAKTPVLDPYNADTFAICECNTWLIYNTEKTTGIKCFHCDREYENKDGKMEIIKPGTLD